MVTFYLLYQGVLDRKHSLKYLDAAHCLDRQCTPKSRPPTADLPVRHSLARKKLPLHSYVSRSRSIRTQK